MFTAITKYGKGAVVQVATVFQKYREKLRKTLLFLRT